MTSQGTAHGRFTRAIHRRNLFQAELALREMGTPLLLVALDYLALLADARPDNFDKAAVRWHGRLELECAILTIAESELALGRSARCEPAKEMLSRSCVDYCAASGRRSFAETKRKRPSACT